MTQAKHTPGPWFTKREGLSTVYVEARISGGMLQEVAACGPTEAGQERQEANAALIAAAPELLEALTTLLDQFDSEIHSEYDGTSMLDARLSEADHARAAIAKATGSAA